MEKITFFPRFTEYNPFRRTSITIPRNGDLIRNNYAHITLHEFGVKKPEFNKIIMIQRLWRWKTITKYMPICEDVKKFIIRSYYVLESKENFELQEQIRLENSGAESLF